MPSDTEIILIKIFGRKDGGRVLLGGLGCRLAKGGELQDRLEEPEETPLCH